mgnify:CR=1 FL=1
MRQVIDEFVLVPRGEVAERINGTMILSETAAFIYEHLEEAIKVRDKKANTVNEQDNPLGYRKGIQNYWLDLRFHALFPCW